MWCGLTVVPWKRIKGRRYFYHSRREGCRVVQDYVGRGAAAERVANLISEECRKRTHARKKRQETQRPYADMDRAVERACGAVQGALTGTLEAAGFHQHHRGEWRRRRGRP